MPFFSPLNPVTIQDKKYKKTPENTGLALAGSRGRRGEDEAPKEGFLCCFGQPWVSPPRSSRRSLRCSMYSSCAILRYFLNSSIIVRRRSTSSCRGRKGLLNLPTEPNPHPRHSLARQTLFSQTPSTDLEEKRFSSVIKTLFWRTFFLIERAFLILNSG